MTLLSHSMLFYISMILFRVTLTDIESMVKSFMHVDYFVEVDTE